MKHIDYLYFNIYNYFHRTSLSKPHVNVRIQSMYLFALGSGGWLLLAEALYLRGIKHTRFASKEESTLFATSIYLLTAALFHYIFIVKHRDLKIFSKYEGKANQNPNRKLHFAISVFVLVTPYLVLSCFPLIFGKHPQ